MALDDHFVDHPLLVARKAISADYILDDFVPQPDMLLLKRAVECVPHDVAKYPDNVEDCICLYSVKQIFEIVFCLLPCGAVQGLIATWALIAVLGLIAACWLHNACMLLSLPLPLSLPPRTNIATRKPVPQFANHLRTLRILRTPRLPLPGPASTVSLAPASVGSAVVSSSRLLPRPFVVIAVVAAVAVIIAAVAFVAVVAVLVVYLC